MLPVVVNMFQDMDQAGQGQTKYPVEENALQVVQGECLAAPHLPIQKMIQ